MIIVRTQDKEHIITCKSLHIYTHGDKFKLGANQEFHEEVDETTTTVISDLLGIYETKERCIEILDEMQNYINLADTIFKSPDGSTKQLLKVFEMPAE